MVIAGINFELLSAWERYLELSHWFLLTSLQSICRSESMCLTAGIHVGIVLSNLIILCNAIRICLPPTKGE